MAAMHGKRGVVTFPSLSGGACEVTSWSVDTTCDVAETTIMDVSAVADGTHWKAYLAGFKDWTGTAELILPAAGATLGVLGDTGSMVMDSTNGLAFTGNAICTGISATNDAQEAGRCTVTFQGIAQLTEA